MTQDRSTVEELEAAFDFGRIGLFDHDHTQDRLYWSAEYRRILDVGPDATPSLAAYLDMIVPEDMPAVEAAVARAHDPGGDGRFAVEHRIMTQAKTIKWLRLTSKTTFSDDPSGRRPLRTVGAVADVTDHRQVEEQFLDMTQKRAAQLAAVLDAVPDAMVTTDVDRKITSANSALNGLFGYSRDEIVGMPANRLYAEPADNAVIAAQWKAWETEGPTQPVFVKCRKKDGTFFEAMVIGNVARSAGGEIESRIGLLRDVSEERARERSYRHAQKMEAVGQLAGGIAHDFNNLLTVIVGNLELLDIDQLPSKYSSVVQQVQEAAAQGAGLTQHLLAFSRQQPLDTQEVRLNDLLLGVSQLLERTLGEHIDISSNLDPDVWPVQSDPVQIESAVTNLSLNARDAMPEGGRLAIASANVSLEADTSTTAFNMAPGDYVRISVTDTGTGIPPEVAERIFEPFFTTKEAGRGTGLGLAMVFGFAKQSGGHLSVHSKVGTGTTFNLYLPRASGFTDAPSETTSGASAASAEGTTILLVEDDERIQKLNHLRLKEMGYLVLLASNGADALDVLDKNPNVDLLFTDVVMPGGMSGFELCAIVHELYPDTRLLLSSGYAEKMSEMTLAPEIKHTTLPKPYRMADLADALKKALAQR